MKAHGTIRSAFEKGGRFERLWPLVDAAETFFFRLPVRTAGGTHVRDAYDLKRMMMIVVLALFPSMAFGTYNVGYQFYASAGITAGHLECLLKGLWVVVPLYAVTFAEMTRVFLRCLRIETTAWRGSMPPAATSGRNGWYVMYGSGSTTVTLASPRASHFSSLRAV